MSKTLRPYHKTGVSGSLDGAASRGAQMLISNLDLGFALVGHALRSHLGGEIVKDGLVVGETVGLGEGWLTSFPPPV